MQNVVNYKCPFFGKDGKPISSGRVHFVKPNTTASDFKGITSADYIVIKNNDDSILENPLSLDSLGQFSIQPFVDDGKSYKMYVDSRTGLPEEYGDDSQCWETQIIIHSKSQEIDIEFDGVPKLNSIDELRNQDPSIGCVVVLGYNSADDGCPSRIFSYENRSGTENYGTEIKTLVQGHNGYWVMKPSMHLDVRWFGIFPNSNVDISQRIAQICSSDNRPMYFPAGEYFFSSNITIPNVIMERYSKFSPYSSNDVAITILNLENRGGTFAKNANGYRVIPCLKGDLRTSWLNGDLNGFLTSAALANVERLIIDTYVQGTAQVNVSSKNVYLVASASLPANVTFNGCSIFKRTSIESPHFTSGALDITEGHIYFNNSLVMTFMVSGKTISHSPTLFQQAVYLDGGAELKNVLRLLSTDSNIYASLSGDGATFKSSAHETFIDASGIITGTIGASDYANLKEAHFNSSTGFDSGIFPAILKITESGSRLKATTNGSIINFYVDFTNDVWEQNCLDNFIVLILADYIPKTGNSEKGGVKFYDRLGAEKIYWVNNGESLMLLCSGYTTLNGIKYRSFSKVN